LQPSDHIAHVIGHPISQSLSPLIHNHWLKKYGIEGTYSIIDIAPEDLETWVQEVRKISIKGWNITIPHKTGILTFLDKVAPLARQMGAVNTVSKASDGTLTGFNTDGVGLMTHLKKSIPDWPQDRPALILGAGGAARAAALMLANENIPMVMISNRTREKAETIASDLGRGRLVVVDWEERSVSARAAGLIINTTSLGMIGQHSLDIEFKGCARNTVYYDIVYKPLETTAMKQAQQQGLRVLDGLGMLVYQAAAAFKIWFGIDPDYDDVLHQKLLDALS